MMVEASRKHLWMDGDADVRVKSVGPKARSLQSQHCP